MFSKHWGEFSLMRKGHFLSSFKTSTFATFCLRNALTRNFGVAMAKGIGVSLLSFRQIRIRAWDKSYTGLICTIEKLRMILDIKILM
jgi:hypothetical protein